MEWLKKRWKLSPIRFFILNLKWNIGFWMSAKPVYKTISYNKRNEKITFDEDPLSTGLKFDQKKEGKTFRKFLGYMYKGGIYLDNEGIGHLVDKETRERWRKKGLI